MVSVRTGIEVEIVLLHVIVSLNTSCKHVANPVTNYGIDRCHRVIRATRDTNFPVLSMYALIDHCMRLLTVCLAKSERKGMLQLNRCTALY